MTILPCIFASRDPSRHSHLLPPASIEARFAAGLAEFDAGLKKMDALLQEASELLAEHKRLIAEAENRIFAARLARGLAQVKE